MINDILIWGVGLWGIIALLLTFVFKMIAWRIEDFTVCIKLCGEDKNIYNRIYNIRSFFEFCGIDEKCTVVLVNYGAPEWFCKEILCFYERYDFLRIINKNESLEEI